MLKTSVQDAAPECSLIDVSDNEIEIKYEICVRTVVSDCWLRLKCFVRLYRVGQYLLDYTA